MDESGHEHNRAEPRHYIAKTVTVFALVAALLGFGIVADFWEIDWPGTTTRPHTSAQAVQTSTRAPLPPLDVDAVAGTVNPSLVNITVSVGPLELQGAGSGIVLTGDGQVLTSHHVIKGAVDISVTDVTTGLIYDATTLGYDSTHDIALLQLQNAADLRGARLGNSDDVAVGDEIVAMGNAGGRGGMPTTSPGKTTALDATIVARNESDFSREYLTDLIEVEAAVAPGQSGGALADTTGAVIGMVTAATIPADSDTDAELPAEPPAVVPAPTEPDPDPPLPTMGYAIPINQVLDVVEQINSGRRSDEVHIGPTATLGVLVTTVDETRPDGTPVVGARIEIAMYGSPAYEAGLVRGDLISAIDGIPVESSKTLREAISARLPGVVIRLDITDETGSTRKVDVVLADGPPN